MLSLKTFQLLPVNQNYVLQITNAANLNQVQLTGLAADQNITPVFFSAKAYKFSLTNKDSVLIYSPLSFQLKDFSATYYRPDSLQIIYSLYDLLGVKQFDCLAKGRKL